MFGAGAEGVRPLCVAVIGAGRAAQAIHLPRLLALPELFKLTAIVDPDLSRARAVAARCGSPVVEADLGALRGVDCVICAAPVPAHEAVVTEALASGYHVLCEKPLALRREAVENMIAARDRSGCVLEVAYMKRHDPAFRRLLDLLPRDSEAIPYIEYVMADPDQATLLDHLTVVDLQDAVSGSWLETPDALTHLDGVVDVREGPSARRPYARGFGSSLIHGINLLHAVLTSIGEPLPATTASASIFDTGAGVSLAWSLAAGGRVSATHLAIPGLGVYEERLTVYTRDRVLELTFDPPYVPYSPARIALRGRGGPDASSIEDRRILPSHEDVFMRQLVAFHRAASGLQGPTVSAEDCLMDLHAVEAAYRWARRGHEPDEARIGVEAPRKEQANA